MASFKSYGYPQLLSLNSTYSSVLCYDEKCSSFICVWTMNSRNISAIYLQFVLKGTVMVEAREIFQTQIVFGICYKKVLVDYVYISLLETELRHSALFSKVLRMCGQRHEVDSDCWKKWRVSKVLLKLEFFFFSYINFFPFISIYFYSSNNKHLVQIVESWVY